MTEPNLEEAVYVPVTNSNYTPEGIVQLEGYVNPASGGVPEDQYVASQKTALEDDPLNALSSGPNDENAWVDPNAEPEPEPEADEPVATSTSDTETEEESPEPASKSFF
jgi:hypothetical protein